MAHYIIHTDGGSRGNPGPAGIGVVIDSAGERVGEYGKTIGSTTNNQAEYQAVHWATELLSEIATAGDQLSFYLDSQLVERQLNGQYKVKDQGLLVWKNKIIEAIKQGGWECEYVSVPREQNKDADRMVNAALDGQI